jgi:indolepyruvate ferredoxin oxidoreductase alpha subunit
LVLILDNGWIGMTGQQPHPGSDIRYYKEGFYKKNIILEKLLESTGAHVNVIKHYENNDETYFTKLKDLIYQLGLDVLENRNLHVIVIKDECIQKIIKRQALTKRYIEKELCNNCGICYSQFLCPAIDERVNFAFIDSNMCLGCGICEEICPNNAIMTEEIQ